MKTANDDALKTNAPAPIVCVAFPAFEGDYLKSTVQLMRQLARRNQVLYIDYAYTWKDFFKSIFGKSHASWRRMIGVSDPLRRIFPNKNAGEANAAGSLHVLTLPPVIPANFIKSPRWYDRVNALNAKFLEKRIRGAMARLGIEAPVVVNAFNPFFGLHLAGRLGEKRLVYYCYDEIGAAAWAGVHGARLEQRFLDFADAVVVSSQGLFRKKSLVHAHCYLVKNGVDFDLFAQQSPANSPSIAFQKFDSQEIVIGYLGSVDERLDYVLLEKVARRFSANQLLFVGRVQESAGVSRLRALKNVTFVGPQPPDTLPDWVRRFDVCLIPFVKNSLTAGIYPLKVNEYLAAGKPVVATRFADLRDFEKVVAISDSDEQFLFDTEKLLREKNNVREVRRRVAFAAENAWSERALEFEKILFAPIAMQGTRQSASRVRILQKNI